MADTRKESTISNEATSPTTQQFTAGGGVAANPVSLTTAVSPSLRADRRLSDEWDAAKVPPSRFQKRKGSIYAVPHSRDGRIDSNSSYAERFQQKLVELGYAKKH
ncbi:hypothetical protein VTI74DRAFT_6491 [Chaetomium olivicolor]